jgi:hypothetical protein
MAGCRRKISIPRPKGNMSEILLWEATNALLLMPLWIGWVIMTRWMRGGPVFTERDWFFLIRHPWEKVLGVHFWIRIATLWFAAVLVGLAKGYVVWPLALAAFVGIGVLTALLVCQAAPKCLR